jgi:hypothetical protein
MTSRESETQTSTPLVHSVPAALLHEQIRALGVSHVLTVPDTHQKSLLASLRSDPDSGAPYQRTSVMTHTAWVPEEWVEAAEDVLGGLAERHPSRTIVLFPHPQENDGQPLPRATGMV